MPYDVNGPNTKPTPPAANVPHGAYTHMPAHSPAAPMNVAPLSPAPLPEPHYNQPIDLTQSINHGFYDSADNSYSEVVSIRAEKKPVAANMHYDPANPNTVIDPFDMQVCYSTYDPATSAPTGETCQDATMYKPQEMGYTPMFTEEFHHGPTYCPQNAPPTASALTGTMVQFPDSHAVTMAAAWNADGTTGTNLMFE